MTRRPCRRCSGNGLIKAYAHVEGGICLACRGNGTVTPDQRRASAAEQAAFARRCELLRALDLRCRERSGASLLMTVSNARNGLEERDPDRFGRMLDAIEAGRVDDVIDALVDYAA